MAFNVRLGDIHAGALTVLPLRIIGLSVTENTTRKLRGQAR